MEKNRCEECDFNKCVYENIRLDELKKYMKKKKWRFEPFYIHTATIFKVSEILERAIYIPKEEIFIMTPKNEEFDDYSQRVEQIIEKLSIIHNITKRKVYMEIRGAIEQSIDSYKAFILKLEDLIINEKYEDLLLKIYNFKKTWRKLDD